MKILKILLSTLFVFSFSSSVYAIDKNLGDGWCSDVRIHFFAGGAEGDGFAGIVQTGAENAIRDTGADAEILYSEWQQEGWIRKRTASAASAAAASAAAASAAAASG